MTKYANLRGMFVRPARKSSLRYSDTMLAACATGLLSIAMLSCGGCGGNSGAGSTLPSPGAPPVTALAASWVSGTTTVPSGTGGSGASGVYGPPNQPSGTETPGARGGMMTWTDTQGNLWLFGGSGVDSMGNQGELNDLWKLSTASDQWVWTGGSAIMPGTSSGVNGVFSSYGTLGQPSTVNIPGGRDSAGAWTDASGNFWLFGGNGIDLKGQSVQLSDLWMFSLSTQQWVWVGGPTLGDQPGTYGTIGQSGAGSLPGARSNAVTWVDGAGNLWLFGGSGLDQVGTFGYLNDLWEFSPTSKQWTWVSGSSLLKNGRLSGVAGVYNTQGQASATGTPGGRTSASAWTDAGGNLWLFGGAGFDSADNFAFLNDLWKFNPSTKQWTWLTGASLVGSYQAAVGSYGTQGQAAAANDPEGRFGASSWTDSSGNLWIFGGRSDQGVRAAHNDLWQYSPQSGQWTWYRGADTTGQSGTYGTQGAASLSNMPGARFGAGAWKDASGNFWLLGGFGYDAVGHEGGLNDMWKLQAPN